LKQVLLSSTNQMPEKQLHNSQFSESELYPLELSHSSIVLHGQTQFCTEGHRAVCCLHCRVRTAQYSVTCYMK